MIETICWWVLGVILGFFAVFVIVTLWCCCLINRGLDDYPEQQLAQKATIANDCDSERR